MRDATVTALTDYYADLFGTDRRTLWRTVTARSHGKVLQGHEGYYVVWRGEGVHVSAPPFTEPGLLEVLEREPLDCLQSLPFWETFAAAHGRRVVGPSTHTYLDLDPGPVAGVVRATATELAGLQRLVDPADWAESGWDDHPEHAFGVFEDGALIAAANLNMFHRQPRDIGVIVAPEARGRGLSELVGRHAASFAVREHGFARWGAQQSNLASIAASRRLGFEPWCTQLTVR